jgi:glutamine cyclotransferase
MCNDVIHLIMSNVTEFLTFRDPASFQTVKTIEVYDNVGPRVRLNELEYINGKIYANVWMLDIILVIDPNTGKVLEQIDCSEVVKAGKGNGEVLNGIAFDPISKKLYLTGKNWSSLLEVSIQ